MSVQSLPLPDDVTAPGLPERIKNAFALPAFDTPQDEADFWFKDDARKHRLRCYMLFTGAVIFALFGVSDYFIAGAKLSQTLTIRFTTSALALAVCAVFCTRQTPQTRELLICCYGGVLLGGNILMTIVSDARAADILPFCLPVLMTFGTILLIPRFRSITFITVLGCIVYLSALPFTPTSTGTTVVNGIFLALSACACLVASFTREKLEREQALTALRLGALNEKAIEANNAKDRLLANVSHELRTPINAIAGFSDVMKNRVHGEITPSRYADYVDDIHFSAILLKTNIDDLLDLSRIHLGKTGWSERACSLADVIATAISICKVEARTNGVTLDYVTDGIETGMMTDPDRLAQAIINIVVNAIKFSARGDTVKIDCRRVAGGYSIAVTDQGCGIGSDFLDKVREPFGQVAANSFNAGKGGLGLGLPIANGFIAKSGGRLDIDSELGKGTTITITFPAHRLIAAAPPYEPLSQRGRGGAR